MKTFKNLKYIGLLAIAVSLTACNDEEDFEEFLDEQPQPTVVLPALNAGSVDFSNYVALGASFTAGFTDGGLFIASQENSFPNTLAKQFANAGGGTFTQPLMSDNYGGLALGGSRIQDPRLVFGGAGPIPLEDAIGPVTVGTDLLSPPTGPFNNVGVPGAKSFHMIAPGYGNLANLSAGLANPYAVRLTGATPDASMLELAAAQNPTFFTLSEVGGNDVLGYATTGGDGTNPITPNATFDFSLNTIVNALTSNGAKGAIGNLPDITSLSHFTTVPFNPLDPTDSSFGPQIPLLNSIFGALNPIFNAVDPARAIVFSETEASAVVIKDESLADISGIIIAQLNASPTFPAFIAQFGLPPAAAPLVANLLGNTYGQTRQATAEDLFVLPSSSVIGTVNTTNVGVLMGQGLPQALAGQFSVEGITLPLEDKWVLLPSEQLEIANATATYNASISAIASAKGLALVDLNSILTQATTTGVQFDSYNLDTRLVFGGLVSLDGIHLTARGYALMANSFLDAIDTTYGSNFRASGNVAKADDFGVNYSPQL
ncbi:G-D-S-L family lipolytic protein [uncultured Lacinutrix sp.]|uniref:G-D-S-L family lipolytic protein n=1 Tax=uncultured Lacinutrix sp. TaxID=574032 RepID=UPI002623754F|nr:G-D-S-L family lipolytic protein [uncultured Lacinutrix sp.]